MKELIRLSIQQPITVSVGVLLAVLAGLLAILRVPVQMTPQVDSVVIAVSTFWESASPEEIETDIIEEQEARLGEITGLVAMTSLSQAGSGQVRLEFATGTDIEAAMAEVSRKLDEVPNYPEGVSEPTVVDIDPESIDYIAWIGLSSTDPSFDTTTLGDFMERRLRPRFERLPGVAEVGVRGSREAELQIHVDPVALAQRGLSYRDLVGAIQASNANFSGGRLEEGKNDLRIRTVGRFADETSVEDMVIRRDAAGPVYVRDVATVTETFKEKTEWVRARGHQMPFFNYQLQAGANLLSTMGAIQDEVAALNAPGGLLEQHAQRLGLNGTLELVQTYDSTEYVNDAFTLVRSNIFVGGFLAVATLLLFLRSIRTIGVIGIAIPISVITAIATLVALGRSVNIISLAGMAFAVGMVVDNAIVVLENIFRHLERGKRVRDAALDGTREVAGAVFASTLTTLVVFAPILFVQEAAGQLFRDIALAIMAAVAMSFVTAVTVIPTAATIVLRAQRDAKAKAEVKTGWQPQGRLKVVAEKLGRAMTTLKALPETVGSFVGWISATWARRLTVIGTFAVVTVGGIAALLPPLDYLPRGNRNIVFSVLMPPPGYSTEQLSEIGARMEERIRPSWEVAGDRFQVEEVVRGGENPREDNRQTVNAGGREVTPPPLDHYFLVAWDGRIFQASIVEDKKRAVDAIALLNHATADIAAPGVFAFSFQLPLFRQGGTTGSAIKIDLKGDDLDVVSGGAAALMFDLIGSYGPYSITPEPANFLLPTPEIRIEPIDERLRELGLTRTDVGLAVQANGDGLLLVDEYPIGGQLKDVKIISPSALGNDPIDALLDTPIATPDGQIVDLRSVARVSREAGPEQIKHVDRQRAVTLQFTPPAELPLEEAIAAVETKLATLRAAGAIDETVEVSLAGSAGKLAEIREVLLGDGTLFGTATSSLFLALVVVYLVMVVLFQSWTYPTVIMTSVPLATLGGFLGLALVHWWSVVDPYMPVQNLDVLTILGFVILAGVVVNNAILIVHQTRNFMTTGDENGERHTDPRQALSRAVATRVRPIMMSTLTSVGGMLPLVLLPGSGSELYRGLGAVVVGGLAVSTIFTLILVPTLLSAVFALQGNRESSADTADNALPATQPETTAQLA